MIPISIAPMMDRTDRHYRYFMRRITGRTLLYTEMVTTGAVIHGDREYLLGFHPDEHPISLQLGGDDPDALAKCCQIAEQYGYDEVNLNVGCPSSRVQSGNFGAALMATPEKVARAFEAMQRACSLPVTVKHRIGIDDIDQYENMLHFVDVVAEAGCERFTVHARKAWLQGLSPKENRNIPPLRHGEIHRLKRERPHLMIETNGGVRDVSEVLHHLEHVDGVMIGRGAYDDPMLMGRADEAVWGTPSRCDDRMAVAEAMIPYVEALNAEGQPSRRVLRHMLNLFAGQPGARAWRRYLTERGREPGRSVIEGALAGMRGVVEASAERSRVGAP